LSGGRRRPGPLKTTPSSRAHRALVRPVVLGQQFRPPRLPARREMNSADAWRAAPPARLRDPYCPRTDASEAAD
jgi:hypothetical protein